MLPNGNWTCSENLVEHKKATLEGGLVLIGYKVFPMPQGRALALLGTEENAMLKILQDFPFFLVKTPNSLP